MENETSLSENAVRQVMVFSFAVGPTGWYGTIDVHFDGIDVHLDGMPGLSSFFHAVLNIPNWILSRSIT